ncbi:MAG: ABC transporter ATP-binding protein [Mesorhizobium sp.]|nr:MAG: ABC transporter ATP-binding protein [Mesorhizobium sp.]
MSEPRTLLRIDRVSKSFGRVRAVDGISLDIRENEFFALLGPSGCGKTTLLRMLAGFETPSDGQILLDGRDIARTPPNKRPVNLMFQSYALFPHMSVRANVSYGLEMERLPAAEIRSRVDAILATTELVPFADRKPEQLSGGQKQRVALARALVKRPRVLLLDEPLGALDKALRVDMQIELKRIQREIGITTIFVTHDQEEALTMSDRIGILRDGRLVQEGPPEEIYDRPQSEFAATFLGDANIFRGDAIGNGIRLPDGTTIAAASGPSLAAGARASCAVRPERIQISTGAAKPDADNANTLKGQVSKRIFAGNNSTYFVDRDGQTLKVIVQNTGAERLAEGQPVVLSWSPDSTVLIAAG